MQNNRLQILDYLYNEGLINRDLFLVGKVIQYCFYKIKHPKMNSSLNADVRVSGGTSVDNMPELCDSTREWFFILDFLLKNKIIEQERTLEVFGLDISYKQLRLELSEPTPHTMKHRAIIRKQNEVKIEKYIDKLIEILVYLDDNVIFPKHLLKKVYNI